MFDREYGISALFSAGLVYLFVDAFVQGHRKYVESRIRQDALLSEETPDHFAQRYQHRTYCFYDQHD
jgi:hypothetical protein